MVACIFVFWQLWLTAILRGRSCWRASPRMRPWTSVVVGWLLPGIAWLSCVIALRDDSDLDLEASDLLEDADENDDEKLSLDEINRMARRDMSEDVVWAADEKEKHRLQRAEDDLEHDFQAAFEQADADKDGLLTAAELRALIASMPGKRLRRAERAVGTVLTQKEAREETEAMMSEADLNGDGKLSFNEIRFLNSKGASEDLAAAAAGGNSEEEIKKAKEHFHFVQKHILDVFKRADANDDDFLSGEEATAFVEGMETLLAQLDEDGLPEQGGSTKRKTTTSAPQPTSTAATSANLAGEAGSSVQAKVLSLFQHADVDQSGHLSQHEVMVLMLQAGQALPDGMPVLGTSQQALAAAWQGGLGLSSTDSSQQVQVDKVDRKGAKDLMDQADANRDHKLSLAELQNVEEEDYQDDLKNARTAGDRADATKERDAALRVIFKTFERVDADHNGVLDKEETARFVHLVDEAIDEAEDAPGTAEAGDASGEGSPLQGLSVDQLKSLHAKVVSMFERLGVDANGAITRQEVVVLAPTVDNL